MAITVYWSRSSQGFPLMGFRSSGLHPVKNIMDNLNDIRKNDGNSNYYQCPAFTDHLHNLYCMPAPFDYDLFVKEDNSDIRTNFYDQKFFDEHILLRSIDKKLISLNAPCFFFPETESLLVSQLPAYLDCNNFTKNTIVVPGTFDIAKWPRAIECAFHMTGNYVSFKENDPLYYIRFHTSEKIILKNFNLTSRINDLIHGMMHSKFNKNYSSKLQFYYDLLMKKKNVKQLMLEEIKKNLLD
jgi:hypothetical protein